MPALAPARVALLSFSTAGPQTWTGTAATVTITGTSGSFTPGAVTWTGTDATVTVTAASGSFTPGTATWTGTDATVVVTASSGSFVQVIAAGYVCVEVAADSVTLTVSEDC